MTDEALYAADTESRTVEGLRCRGCRKLLAVRVSRPYEIRCSRCKAVNAG